MSRYSIREEKANIITHAIGLPLGGIAAYILLNKSIPSQNFWLIASQIVYIIGMLLSYFTSTFYHAEKSELKKIKLRKLDHAAIYLHIAGTYTPFTLVVLRNESAWGWSLFSIIWAAAASGVVLSFIKLKNSSKLETACYVAMGWVVIIAFKPLYDALSNTNSIQALWWLVAGGAFYTIGAILYSLKKIEFMHAIWHLFVLGGSICHAIAIWNIKP